MVTTSGMFGVKHRLHSSQPAGRTSNRYGSSFPPARKSARLEDCPTPSQLRRFGLLRVDAESRRELSWGGILAVRGFVRHASAGELRGDHQVQRAVGPVHVSETGRAGRNARATALA